MKLFFNVLIIVLLFVFSGCKQTEDKQQPSLALVNAYYEALDTSDTLTMATLLQDTLLTKETEYNYEQLFTQAQYKEWMQWDAVFNPTYEVLAIKESDKGIETKVSKIDTRISFLHEEPIVINQLFILQNNKIKSIETTKYVTFHDSVFVKNRDSLVAWVKRNHPELDGFLYDQTVEGATKYLEAIQRYTSQ